MADTTTFSVRMDTELKKQCEALYGELGMNLTTAINVFLRQSLRAGGFRSMSDWKSPAKKPSPPCWKPNGSLGIPT